MLLPQGIVGQPYVLSFSEKNDAVYDMLKEMGNVMKLSSRCCSENFKQVFHGCHWVISLS